MSTSPTWKPRQVPVYVQRQRDFDHYLSGFVLGLVVVCVACALFVQTFRGVTG